MSRSPAVCALLAWAAASAQAADTSLAAEVDRYLETTEPAAQDPNTLRAFWDKGLKFETADGNVRVELLGRLFWDNVWMSSGDVAGSSTLDTSFFRAARLGFGGTVYKNVLFRVEVDFAPFRQYVESVSTSDTTTSGSPPTPGPDGQVDAVSTTRSTSGSPALKSVFLGLKGLGHLGTLRAGHFKEPFGLEESTSSRFLTFMERSAPSVAFAPSFNNGIMLDDGVLEGRATWAVGVFRDADDQAQVSEDGGYNLTLRLTGLLLDDKDAQALLHGGFGFSFRDPNGETVRYRARPGTGTGTRFVDTGNLGADEVVLFNVELLLVWRSFHAQLEFFLADVSAPAGVAAEPRFAGWYVEVGYWITGEARKYKGNVCDRTSPRKNLHAGDGGWGAWQVAFRFDSLDLTDDTIVGGEQATYTLGVNWHWNPNTRVMFNVIFANVEEPGAPDIDVEIFQMRFQFDF